MLNGGMTPWDYYAQGSQIAQRNSELGNQNAELQARMQQMRTQQIRENLMMQQAQAMLPARMAMMQAQASRLDPNSSLNKIRQTLLQSQADANKSRADYYNQRARHPERFRAQPKPPVDPNDAENGQLATTINQQRNNDYQSQMSDYTARQDQISKARSALTDAGLGGLMGTTSAWGKTTKPILAQDGKTVLTPAGAATEEGADVIAAQTPQGYQEFPVPDSANVGGLMTQYRLLQEAQKNPPSAPERPLPLTTEHIGLLRNARDAIRMGIDPGAVKDALQKRYGVDPSLLNAVPPSGSAPNVQSPPAAATSGATTDAGADGEEDPDAGLADYVGNGGLGGQGMDDEEDDEQA